jgi:hypothetical protein
MSQRTQDQGLITRTKRQTAIAGRRLQRLDVGGIWWAYVHAALANCAHYIYHPPNVHHRRSELFLHDLVLETVVDEAAAAVNS